MTREYYVCGWRYRHVDWPAWALVNDLPPWLTSFIKRESKRAKRYWIVERLYHHRSAEG